MTVALIPTITSADKYTFDRTKKTMDARLKKLEKGSLYLHAKEKTYAIARMQFTYNPDNEKDRREEYKEREELLERVTWIQSTFPNSDYFITCYAVERLDGRIESIYYEQGVCDMMDICMADELDKNPVRNELFTTKEKCGFGHSMAMAVQYLHDKEKVHQDVKPENYVYLASGAVKMIDFEGMRDIESDESRMWFITPQYASPDELKAWLNDESALPATFPPKAKDLWQLGVALRILFQRELNSLPEWLSELLRKYPQYDIVYSRMKEDKHSSQHPWFGTLLQFDPRDRRSASEVAERLALEADIK